MSRLTLWLTALLALSSVLPAAANDTEPASATTGADSSRAEISDIKIGFDDAYKVGHWTPIAVTLEAGSEDLQGHLEVQTLDGDEAPAMIRGPAVRLSAGTRQNLSMLVKPGRPQAPITLRVVDDDAQALHEQTFADVDIPKALLATQGLMVQLGGSIGLEQIGRLYEADHPEKVVTAAGDISTLPEDWLGYDGADVVVISTSDSMTHDKWSRDRVAALDRWVRMGGTLILCIGREGANVLAKDASLARFAPGEFDSVVSRGPGALGIVRRRTFRADDRSRRRTYTADSHDDAEERPRADRAQRWQYSAGCENPPRIRHGDLRRSRSGPAAVYGVVCTGQASVATASAAGSAVRRYRDSRVGVDQYAPGIYRPLGTASIGARSV